MVEQSAVAKLKELRKRLNKGEINHEEFENQKGQILSSSSPSTESIPKPASRSNEVPPVSKETGLRTEKVDLDIRSKPKANAPARPEASSSSTVGTGDSAIHPPHDHRKNRGANGPQNTKPIIDLSRTKPENDKIVGNALSSTEELLHDGEEPASRPIFKHAQTSIGQLIGDPGSSQDGLDDSASPDQRPSINAHGSWLLPALFIGPLLMIGLAAVFLWPSKPPGQNPANTPRPVQAIAPGVLRLVLDPPGMAQLDAFMVPDGGQRSSRIHTFSGLEPRTYTLKVWANGYQSSTQRVSISSSKTTETTVRLHR